MSSINESSSNPPFFSQLPTNSQSTGHARRLIDFYERLSSHTLTTNPALQVKTTSHIARPVLQNMPPITTIPQQPSSILNHNVMQADLSKPSSPHLLEKKQEKEQQLLEEVFEEDSDDQSSPFSNSSSSILKEDELEKYDALMGRQLKESQDSLVLPVDKGKTPVAEEIIESSLDEQRDDQSIYSDDIVQFIPENEPEESKNSKKSKLEHTQAKINLVILTGLLQQLKEGKKLIYDYPKDINDQTSIDILKSPKANKILQAVNRKHPNVVLSFFLAGKSQKTLQAYEKILQEIQQLSQTMPYEALNLLEHLKETSWVKTLWHPLKSPSLKNSFISVYQQALQQFTKQNGLTMLAEWQPLTNNANQPTNELNLHLKYQGKEDYNAKCPHLAKLALLFNEMSNAIVIDILSKDTLNERVVTAERYIQCAHKAMQYKNHVMCSIIISAFKNTSIEEGLPKTMGKLSLESQKQLEECKQFIDVKLNTNKATPYITRVLKEGIILDVLSQKSSEQTISRYIHEAIESLKSEYPNDTLISALLTAISSMDLLPFIKEMEKHEIFSETFKGLKELKDYAASQNLQLDPYHEDKPVFSSQDFHLLTFVPLINPMLVNLKFSSEQLGDTKSELAYLQLLHTFLDELENNTLEKTLKDLQIELDELISAFKRGSYDDKDRMRPRKYQLEEAIKAAKEIQNVLPLVQLTNQFINQAEQGTLDHTISNLETTIMDTQEEYDSAQQDAIQKEIRTKIDLLQEQLNLAREINLLPKADRRRVIFNNQNQLKEAIEQKRLEVDNLLDIALKDQKKFIEKIKNEQHLIFMLANILEHHMEAQSGIKLMDTDDPDFWTHTIFNSVNLDDWKKEVSEEIDFFSDATYGRAKRLEGQKI